MTPIRKVFLIMSLPLVLTACRGRAGTAAAGGQQTQTIAPAAAKPAPPNDNEALTQTVDIEDSRSEADGAATNLAPPPPPAPAKKAAPPVKKKK